MGFNLFAFTGTIDADTKPFDRSLGRAQAALRGFASFASRVSSGISRSFARIGRSVSGIANGLRAAMGGPGLFGALSAAALAAGAFASIGKAVMGASDLSETLSKVGVVFGSSVGIVTRGADDMAKRFGVVKTEFLDAAANLGLVGKAAGMSQGEAARMADGLAKLALDASSFFNVPLGEALMSMRSGLVGEAEPLRRFGVLLSETAVKQEAVTMGLSRGKAELSESAKVRARVSIITRQLADAQGDLARTSDGFANQLKKFSGQATNVLSSLGMRILPIFRSLVIGTTTMLDRIGAAIEANGAYILDWSVGVGQAISRVSLIWEHFGDFKALGILMIQEKFLQGWAIITRVLGTAWDVLKYGAETTQSYLHNFFEGLARYLETLFTTLGQNLGDNIRNGILESIRGLTGSLGPILMGLPGMSGLGAAVMSAQGIIPAGAVPRGIHGDASGLGKGSLAKDINLNPDLLRRFADALPNLSHKIEPILARLDGALAAGGISDLLKKAPVGLASLLKRPMTATEALNASNVRGSLSSLIPKILYNTPKTFVGAAGVQRVPFVGSGTLNPQDSPDRQQQANAARVLRARREREARDNARETRQFRGADFGRSGQVARLGGRLAESFAKRMGAGEGLGGVIRSAAAFAIGGATGLLAARQPGGGGGRGNRRRPLGGFAGGNQPIDPSFRSEFVGLSELSRKISTDALSGKGKDPQLNALESIAGVLGAGGSNSNSVLGKLTTIANKPAGPGFAT
jgi:hypothetical protein